MNGCPILTSALRQLSRLSAPFAKVRKVHEAVRLLFQQVLGGVCL